MNFASDNWAGAAKEIAASLSDHSGGFSAAYGDSEFDRSVERRFNEIFEREVAVYFVGTGTAANSLSLSSMTRPGGFVFCHRESHLIEDECGAPEFFTSGARMSPIDGPMGRMDVEALGKKLAQFESIFVHHGQPMAVSVTQATEAGSVYSIDHLKQISQLTHDHGLKLHMDGARFANAMVRLGATPAEMTWKSGVDVLSFGATKNGCWCAEAIIFFDPDHAKQVPFIRKRAAQLFSKTRFITAQLDAYLKNDLWIQLASHANQMAQRLIVGIKASKNVTLAWPCESNEVFVTMPKVLAAELERAGVSFYPWPIPTWFAGVKSPEIGLYRLVTSFATTSKEVDDLIQRISG
ncbi:low specificity L-threonine aldolase [Rubripirellula sp.]|nr:low specificity L-threonine aldolase [Rubripirellula sp.]